MIVYEANLLHSLTIHRFPFLTDVATKPYENNHVLQFKTELIKVSIFCFDFFLAKSFIYKDKYICAK